MDCSPFLFKFVIQLFGVRFTFVCRVFRQTGVHLIRFVVLETVYFTCPCLSKVTAAVECCRIDNSDILHTWSFPL